jgi:hypothetical protein
MSAQETLKQAMEDVYASLHNDNEGLENQIKNLKIALAGAGVKEAEFIPERLPHNNRQGRKMMQTYFKKRGVIVVFEKKDA